MEHPAIFETQPFTGQLAEGPSQYEFEFLSEEVGRGRTPPPRGRSAQPPRPAPRAARRTPPRPAARAASRRLPASRRPPARPPQGTPPRRPRGPSPWPVWSGGYALPTLDPFGYGPETTRCVQACLAGGPAPAPAMAEPPAAPEPADPPADTGGDSGADAAPPAEEFEFAPIGQAISAIGKGIGKVVDYAADTLRGCKIIDLTAQSDHSLRKGLRDPASVYALVLHQMGCCWRRKDPMRSYLRTNAHFAILPEGQILQLHPVRELLESSNGLNTGSVAVEFAGNFPSDRGKWWRGATYGRNQVTPAQLDAGRCLVRHLQRTMALRAVLAHRQSSGTRGNDPGPDIWYHVGQWAIDHLGMSDGGAGFKVGSGAPIPDSWRSWGRRGTPPTPELSFEADEAGMAYEDEGQDAYEMGDEAEAHADSELWRGPSEGEVPAGLLGMAQAIADPRARGSGLYTLYKDGRRVYVGESREMRRRLQQHLLCLTHLKLGVGRFHVKLTPMPGAPPAQLKRVQAATIARFGQQSRGGQLANKQAREFEAWA